MCEETQWNITQNQSENYSNGCFDIQLQIWIVNFVSQMSFVHFDLKGDIYVIKLYNLNFKK